MVHMNAVGILFRGEKTVVGIVTGILKQEACEERTHFSRCTAEVVRANFNRASAVVRAAQPFAPEASEA